MISGRAIDAHGADWRNWVQTNVAAGCDPAEMIRLMVAGGWAEGLAIEAISIAQANAIGGPQYLARPALPAMGHCPVGDHVATVTMVMDAPGIALIENVVSPDECQQLIDFAMQTGLAESTVVDAQDGRAVPHPERTSTGLMLPRAGTPLVARIESRLAQLTNWPIENGEGVQILRYQPGQEYRPHFDAFPDGPAGAVHLARGGQRVSTILVYLHVPTRGGGTHFPNLGLTLCPQQGGAIMFYNVDPMGQRLEASLHSGEPVDLGEKVIMTYWQRAGVFA